MQERYLGDSHDFLKYALLRHLHGAVGERLGINWYLTQPEQVDRPGNNDGEKRHHLKGGVWEQADPALFKLIHQFEDPATRTIGNVSAWEILPTSTCYHDRVVATSARDAWHRDGVAALAEAGLIFLDPDNGFEVPSMQMRTRPKYAFYAEALDYARRGQTVVAIQFARQCDPVQRAKDIRDRLVAMAGEAASLPVVRGRVAPNLLFFTIAPVERASAYRTALQGFVAKCGKAELIL